MVMYPSDWATYTFDEMFQLYPNNTLSRDKLSNQGTIGNIHYGDVLIKYGAVLSVKDSIPKIKVEYESSARAYLQQNDVIVADTAEDETVGKVVQIGMIPFPLAGGLHTIVCRPLVPTATGYLGYYMNSREYHDQLLPYITGIKVSSVSKASIRKTELHIPSSVEEQEAIVDVIERFDTYIANLGELIEKKKAIRDGVLEDLMSGRTRLDGFNDRWNSVRLGEICSLITKGTTPLDKSGRGNINFIKVENIDPSSGNIRINQKITTAEHTGYLNRSQLQVDDILFSIAGTLGRVAVIKEENLPANTNQALAIIRLKAGHRDYVKYFLTGESIKTFIKENGNRITVHYVDWTETEKNDFYVAEEVTVLRYDNRTTKRPDLVLYVNGIAVAIFELKRSSVSIGEGIRQMLTNQQKENIQGFFNTTQLLMAGNESEGLKYGVVETPEKYYLQWREDTDPTRVAKNELSQKILAMQAAENNRLRDGVISLCQHDRLLMLIHDFMIFDAGRKKTARHNQFFAVQAAQQRIKDGEGGIIWNTQGSGKSLIMVWLTKWIRENITDSRVVIITDRDELDDQIESLFFDVGEKKVKRAKNCADLREILNTNEYPIVCSLIHKYGHNAGKDADIDKYVRELTENLPKDYKAKGNIIGFIDECHRTNSGKLHKAVEVLMPDAVLIGFTGTPLLKGDKEKSIETFGSYIHTYKFDEGVRDRVILDLRYEARDVNQELSSPEKIDQWFELKTQGLTDRAKMQLKQAWTTISKLYSSKERLERIAADIIFDMSDSVGKPRLATDRGTAMLVADSIYEACKYWEIFQSQNFTRCAVVTSYEPTAASVRTATSDPAKASEEEYKKKTYERMLGGKKLAEFEAEVKEMFKKSPAKMKLLIVVDKLLTGFDAPSATYLYIDKRMRDHDLFQSICRVNRPDGEDKDYGYIVDYMDLFRNIQSAVHDYTSDAFDQYNKEDIEGLIKDRYEEAKSEMVGSLTSLKDLLANVPDPKAATDNIEYFCGSDSESDEKTASRDTLYALTASLTRSFASCCNRLVADYGYTEQQVTQLRNNIDGYNKIKEMIKLASCDYIDLKPYEADMRYILDTYIRADDSKFVNKMADMSLVELLLEGRITTPADLIKDLPGDKTAKAETIENNLKHEIVKKMSSNEVYYGKLSEMLEDVIEQRKIAAMSYEEYLRQVVELAQAILHPEEDDTYPEGIRDSAARRAIYDYLECNYELTIGVDGAIRISVSPDWHTNHQRTQKVRIAIYKTLSDASVKKAKVEEQRDGIFDIAKRQEEYDR